MKQKLDIFKWLMPLVCLLAVACGHDDLVGPDVYEEEPPAPYVELRIAIPAVNPYSTRSHPVGGEDGNGREKGIENEDNIHDVNIFFYNDPNGLDGEDNTPILHHVYVNVDNLKDTDNSPLLPETGAEFEKNYLKLKLSYEDEMANLNAGTNFAAVANLGRIQKEDIKTLKDLRELDVSRYAATAWQKYDAFSNDASKMDYFLMSTAYNQDYTYGDEHTGSNKIEVNGRNYFGTTTLERMYARIDLWYNKNQIQTKKDGDKTITELDYQIKDKDKTILENHHVYITNVLPVNVMQSPSYLFKKVSSTEPNSWNLSILQNLTKFSWGGKELTDANGVPSNYVLTPTSTLENTDKEDLEKWFKNSRTQTVKENIKDNTKGAFSVYYNKEQSAGAGDPQDYNCNWISIISYANENTHATDCFHSNYLTGLAFRAIYVPDKIYKKSTVSDETDLVSTADNLTEIYRYSPTGPYSNETQTPPTLQLEQKSIYFTNRDEAETYAKAHTGDMGVITKYTATLHTDDKGNTKWGFICYYNLWLRHYNDETADPQKSYPMEYATVRNNIYRVKVDFNGPGDPNPEMREPDTMKARIFVRKWNYREESTIIF